MSALVRTKLRAARTALRDFLRGFVGVGAAPAACDHEHGPASPASAREALSAQAARRGRCC
jgi:hypothetical protein